MLRASRRASCVHSYGAPRAVHIMLCANILRADARECNSKSMCVFAECPLRGWSQNTIPTTKQHKFEIPTAMNYVLSSLYNTTGSISRQTRSVSSRQVLRPGLRWSWVRTHCLLTSTSYWSQAHGADTYVPLLSATPPFSAKWQMTCWGMWYIEANFWHMGQKVITIHPLPHQLLFIRFCVGGGPDSNHHTPPPPTIDLTIGVAGGGCVATTFWLTGLRFITIQTASAAKPIVTSLVRGGGVW